MVFWSPIPESLRNGIITGYRIFYKQLSAPVRNLKRAPRSVNDLTLLGAQPGEQVQDVNGTAYKANLEGLKKHSWYQIRIGALTSKGLGPTFSINGTCKQEGSAHIMLVQSVIYSLDILTYNPFSHLI